MNSMTLEEKSIPQLVEYIEAHFHSELLKLFPQVIDLAEKVERVHKYDVDCPRGLKFALDEVWNELKFHMDREEQVLFPLIRNGRFTDLSNPQALIENQAEEHRKIITQLEKIKKQHILPDHACPSWKTLHQRLQKLLSGIEEHFKAEEQILFPRALEIRK